MKSIRAALFICLSLSFSWAHGESPAPAGPVEAVEVKPYPCKVAWSDQEVLCATYPVWENRETRQGRKIGLNIVILPALGPDKQPDPVFEIAGGPGQAVGEVGEWAGIDRRKRDIVLVDQRGTGRSNPLHCDLYGNPIDFRLAAGELFPADAVRSCREKLEKVADLSQYTSAAFADDLNEVRQWLGYGKINLIGGSYGSRAAQVYWQRHPETVRSVVLTSVAPLDLFLPLRHAYAGQRALDLLLEECASQPECRATFPDTRADLKALKERIDKGVTANVTNTRTGEKQEVRPTWGLVAEGIRYALYGPEGASLPLLLRNAAQGDLAPLVQASIERRLDLTVGFEGRLYYNGLNFSVTCAEDLPFITEEMTRRETAGTYLGDYRVRQQKDVCKIWPRGKVPANIHEAVRSDVPVLLVSGERDPATPPEMAEMASRHMKNRLHVVIPRGAHGGGGQCRDKLTNDFLDRASVRGLEPSCAVSESKPTQFTRPAPTAPVAAVETKPYPCRVPGLDQDVLCATYPVWENRETKQGRKIGLNIVILPATEPATGPDKPDPIFEFGGGPGQGIAGSAPGFAGSPLTQKRDMVLVDQRGTGGSNPLHCDFYGEPLDLRLATGDMFPISAVEKCREKLEKVADLTQYTTAAFADDLNEVRQWLGYGKINLEGGSYGTRSAMVYWRRHPETVRSVVLVGTTGLDVYLPVEHAAAGQRALDLLLAECAAQPECRAAFPDTRADLKAVRERIEQGVTVTVTNPRTNEKQEVQPTWGLVAESMRFLMYGEAAAGLPLQIRQAAQGDFEPLIRMAIERRLNITDGIDWGLNFSVSCAEDLPFITEERIREKTAGTYLGDYRIRQQKAVCKVWPRARIAADTHAPVRSDVPVLLVSGERDPVTPPDLANQASRFMTNRLHVVVPRGSHGVSGECMINLLREFLDRASVQELDTSCVATIYGPTQFTKP
ncbi:MAG TPA: alpha/beta fold hydrolase [Thermoanaerobaculia bacterium]|nr:alpha/beta fold hydrolase [Thermoanaerobaculia bacterium]